MNSLREIGRGAHRNRYVRFLLAGGLNTLFGYTLYLLGLAAHLRPELALAVATVCGAVFNYFTVGRFVFGHKALDLLPRFVGGYAVLYGLNAAAIRALLALGAGPALAQALLLPVMAIASFALFRTFVFKLARPG